ncbi:hypothetical protein ACHQM5_024442 [Ranunculus cassubicifolius]
MSKKILNIGLSFFRIGFNSSKCKTMAKLVTARIKLLRNKREVVVRQMRRDVALLLQSGQDATARIRVEHVMREENVMAANEIIELFCELVVARLSIIAKQRECPADLKEGISSLIFAAPRCSDIPELFRIKTIFEKKYGKEFVNSATELRPNCCVNRLLIEKLSVRTPTGQMKLKLMKEIAKEYQIAWDHSESEKELLKPPEELIDGPRKFVSATSMPVKPVSSQVGEPDQSTNSFRISNERRNSMDFEDSAAAAKVAAESADKAVAAAQAAAYLAKRDTCHDGHGHGNSSHLSFSNDARRPTSDSRAQERSHNVGENYPSRKEESLSFEGNYHGNSSHLPFSTDSQRRTSGCSGQERSHNSGENYASRKEESSTFGGTDISGGGDIKGINRRHSYSVPTVHSDIKFDESDGPESDYDEEERPVGIHHPCAQPPPERPAPPLPEDKSNSYRRNSLPRVHPKLPDYEDISARFEALKFYR